MGKFAIKHIRTLALVGQAGSGKTTLAEALLAHAGEIPAAGSIERDSTNYNHGRAFVAPVPLLSYDFGPVKLNAVVFPKYMPYNQFTAFGFYLGIPPGR